MTNFKKCLLVTIISTAFLRLYSFFIPVLDVDETIFGTIASSILHGGRLYVDVADIKPPLIFFFYYMNWIAFGEYNFIALHIFTSFWIILTAFVVGRIGKELVDDSTGNLAMIFYAIGSTLGEPKLLSSNINIIMALPISLSFYFFIIAYRRERPLFFTLSGIFAAVASLFRFQGGFIGIVICFCIALLRTGFFKKIMNMLYLSIGVAAVYILCGLYFFKVGALKEAIDWSFIYGLKYSSLGSEFSFWPRFLSKTGLYLFAVLPLILLLLRSVYVNLRKISTRDVLGYLLIWFVVMWWPVCMGRRFYGHYYLMLLPQLAILSAWGFLTIKSSRIKYAVISMLVAWATFFLLTRVDAIHFREIFGIHSSDWEEISELQCPIGEYIKKETDKDDVVMVWGFASPIYYCADRSPASHFLSPDMLVNRVSGGNRYKNDLHSEGNSMFLDGLWKDLLSDLENKPPAYIVDMSGSKAGAYQDFPLERYPIRAWMEEKGYSPVTTIKGAVLYSNKRN